MAQSNYPDGVEEPGDWMDDLNVQDGSENSGIRIRSRNDGEYVHYTIEMDPLPIPADPDILRAYREDAERWFEAQKEYIPLLERMGLADLLFGWAWDDEDKAYRNDETGELMDEETFIALRDDIVDWQVDYFSKWPLEEDEEPEDEDDPNILGLLLLGIIALGVWEEGMRRALQDASVIQYAVGRGGFDQMTDDDWNWLDSWLLIQYDFLNGFSHKIATGVLSEAQIAANSYLYFSSSVAAFEQGRMKGQDVNLNLTRHPGDCTSQCCARDRCFWRYVRRRDRIVISWVRTAKESCFACIDRGNCPPVVFMKDTGEHINMECYENADAA
jgi:hypothetical protein